MVIKYSHCVEAGYNNIKKGILAQLEKLQTSYIDMYMMDCFPGDRKVWVEMYKCLEDFYKKGVLKTIGVNIVYMKELEEINRLVRIPPMFIEQKADIYDLGRAILMHQSGLPGHLRWDSDNDDIVGLAHSLHIAITSWGPLSAEPFKMIPLQDPIVASVANRLHVSPARLTLRYLMQLGFLPITLLIIPPAALPNLATKPKIAGIATAKPATVSKPSFCSLVLSSKVVLIVLTKDPI